MSDSLTPKAAIELTEVEIDLLVTGLEMWRQDRDTGDDWSDVEALKKRLSDLSEAM